MSNKLDTLCDPDAERALLGACLLDPKAIDVSARYITAADFNVHRHREIYAEILDQHKTGRVDVVTVATKITDDGALSYLHDLINATPSISNAHTYAQAIANWKLRRDLVHAGDQVTSLAYSHDDGGEAADIARALLDQLDTPVVGGDPDPTMDEFIASTPTEYNWLIPDFLERQDRLLVTAAEGSGKSVLIAQIGVMAAAGIHPWTWQEIEPCNVLIVDLENGPRLVSRRLDWLRSKVGPFDQRRVRVHADPRGINLTSRTDKRWLMERVEANRTDMLVIGPAYRMTAGVAAKGDVGGEDHIREVTKALDDIRARFDVTLVLETHAPHSQGPFGRDLRPFGSSVWLRWPEFGIGIRRDDPDPDGTPREYKLEHWRGPRDQRTWPKRLIRGDGRMPWTPDQMPDGTFTNNALQRRRTA